MASSINASTTAGVVTTADTSGVLNIQTAGTTAISIDASQAVSFTNSANLPNTFGFKNRIINGAMVIDQRNAGASVNPTDGQYCIDRWILFTSQASKYTAQQNAGSVTPPAGFTNYLGITSSSAYSVTSSDYFVVEQKIEGFNVADLNWGSANATAVTLSFWVRSSLTGTFGGVLKNSAGNRSYPFTYTISAANTWEQKAITIAGDTTGTWVTNNGTGIRLQFSLGAGSSLSGTAGAWAAASYSSATGATSVVGTNGATFYITGVQLEKGATATSFDYRDYGRELIMCQRYYETSYDPGTAVGAAPSAISYPRWSTNGTANAVEKWFRVTKRATPTVTVYDTSGTVGKIRIFDGVTDPANITPTAILGLFNSMYVTYNATASGIQFNYVAQSEL